ncbi:hypothetical protein [Paracoccus zhejiangensis]|uniref:hypothetical protein n=1 Tax=Paracoccus zhejiangensis TaxID=1077935 RepID=UPI0012FFF50E|nr:hypothetical protein [Paracoccus zhejiangensis]
MTSGNLAITNISGGADQSGIDLDETEERETKRSWVSVPEKPPLSAIAKPARSQPGLQRERDVKRIGSLATSQPQVLPKGRERIGKFIPGIIHRNWG